MRSSFYAEDATLLLKDITGGIEPLDTITREKSIQKGTHYCEMLPVEYKPTDEYLCVYRDALVRNAEATARAVAVTAENIFLQKGKGVTLVSLARAGIPAGILIKRYLRQKYGIDVPHYAISIIRGRGIDRNALQHILSEHTPDSIQFVDGWTGKGAIVAELDGALKEFPQLNSGLAVLADPAGVASIYGTKEDFLIASCCLNATVCGLISRTVLRTDLIGESDFHGAVYYGELSGEDRTYEFINNVEAYFDFSGSVPSPSKPSYSGLKETLNIAEVFGISNLHLVKPGIGEATRVLLRRYPWKLLIKSGAVDSPDLKHLLRLASEKNVQVEEFPLKNYLACGLIRSLGEN